MNLRVYFPRTLTVIPFFRPSHMFVRTFKYFSTLPFTGLGIGNCQIRYCWKLPAAITWVGNLSGLPSAFLTKFLRAPLSIFSSFLPELRIVSQETEYELNSFHFNFFGQKIVKTIRLYSRDIANWKID